MSVTNQFLKSLRITKSNGSRKIPTLPAKTSPLFTHFEKWAGKPRKLLIKDINLLKSFNLQLDSNPFAQLLSSPTRLDRIGKVKLPKLFSIQVDSNLKSVNPSMKFNVHSNVKDKSRASHSYILNKLSVLEKKLKNSRSVLPLHILANLNNENKNLNLKFNSTELLDEYLSNIKQEIIDSLNKLMTIKTDTSKQVSSNIIVKYDTADNKTLKIDTKTNGYEYTLTFNLAKIKDPQLEDIFNKASQLLYLNEKRDMAIILQIYRLLMLVA